MATQVDASGNIVVTPQGNTVTTPNQSPIRSAATTVANSANVIVGEVGSYATGFISGAVGQAIAPVVDVAKKANQVYNLVQNPTLGGALSLLGRGFPPYRNELDQFASYNYIFTLGCLTSLELNFPLSYKTLGPAVKIIKSGGTGGNKIPTIYETDGQREFFIDDVELLNHCAPNPDLRLTTALQIKFTVTEPYSMGQFLHNLRTAALVTGHANYLEAPYLLSVEFIGYDDEGNVKAPFFSRRHFPIKLVEANMQVSGAGSEYEVLAVPYNEVALSDSVNRIPTDMQLKGSTVAEVLQTGAESLTAKLNTLEAELVKAKQKPAEDYYIISFPSPGLAESAGAGLLSSAVASAANGLKADYQQLYESITGDVGGDVPADLQEKLEALPGATTLGSPLAEQLRQLAASDINAIGQSTINLSGTGWGPPNDNPPYQEANFVENEDNPGTFSRGRITYDPDYQTFQFSSVSKITDIIEEVLLSSQYAREWIRENPDAQGRTTWFKIHTHVYNGSSLLGGLITGKSPKIYVYRVVPYKVSASRYSPPKTEIFNALGIAQQAAAVKAYNYIYTGQNNEIIDFDLRFNLTFITGAQASRAQRQLANVLGGSTSVNNTDQQPATTTATETAGAGGDTGATGSGSVVNTPGPSSGTRRISGGGGANDTETALARDLNDAVINTDNDLLQIDLTIHGDPYFLADAGIGNFLGIPNPANEAITVDGSMNPVNGEVSIILNFRTPIDYDEDDGFVKYPLGGFLPIAMFSGLYLVLLVENKFKQGKFTQKLTLARQKNQDLTVEKLTSAIVSRVTGAAGAAGKFFGLGDESNRMGPPTQTSESNT